MFLKEQKAKLKAAGQKRKALAKQGDKKPEDKKNADEKKGAGAAASVAASAAKKAELNETAKMLDDLNATLLLNTCVEGHRPSGRDAELYAAVAAMGGGGPSLEALLKRRPNVQRW